MKMLYKSQIIIPYESFYRRASEGFCRGSIGGGISRTCKCDDDLTILEVVYEQNNDTRLCLEESAERCCL